MLPLVNNYNIKPPKVEYGARERQSVAHHHPKQNIEIS